MDETHRTAALAKIRHNIDQSGFHLYIITGGVLPRFAYTVGLSESLGAELVLAGGGCYSANDVKSIFHVIHQRACVSGRFEAFQPIEGLGMFALRQVHASWATSLMVGALDYYGARSVHALQIVPDQSHVTVDVPDMSVEWSATTEPVWQWLHASWQWKVPRTSTVTTNLDALRGKRITEVTRWEEDHWEMFAGAGPDVSEADVRVVPLACLLAVDPGLAPALDLGCGSGLWRDAEQGEWRSWVSRKS